VKIYTIGHSNRKIEDLLLLLKKYNISIVIDVRRFPTSKLYPWFKKENLSKKIGEHGIEYIWLGDILGGYRKGGYQKYMETREYKKGIEILIRESKKKNIAILCSEKLWFRCHRRFIADTLCELGLKVIHIIDKDKTYIHKTKT
jgi:uncharacterized protein (DUF488 family)